MFLQIRIVGLSMQKNVVVLKDVFAWLNRRFFFIISGKY
jgi:hypothetical protein